MAINDSSLSRCIYIKYPSTLIGNQKHLIRNVSHSVPEQNKNSLTKGDKERENISGLLGHCHLVKVANDELFRLISPTLPTMFNCTFLI